VYKSNKVNFSLKYFKKMSTQNPYNQYKTALQKIADIKYASAVLQWDQETYLPKNGNDARGRQIATLNELAHEYFTTESFGNMLTELSANQNLSAKEKRNVALSTEDYSRNKKIPSAFVHTLSSAVNIAYHAWIQARRENSFSIFEKPLQQIINLKKQEADLLGYEKHPYDALMNDYDKGLTTTITDKLFTELKPQLLNILEKIAAKPQVDNSMLHQHFDKTAQWETGIEILKRMHFNFDAGRQDISEHPFTTNFSSQDVRVTTRVDENDFSNMLWSCIHEGGHALYEQGLPDNEYGMPLGEYCSLSIHESQSRLWENCIGRGLPFWQHNYALLQQKFPQQFPDLSINNSLKSTQKSSGSTPLFGELGGTAFYAAINKVQPSLIRTEADELTYHFHVIIRYEIEKLLIEGTISAKDIPAYWNEQYKKYLRVNVPDDLHGCLQDVHWSHGSFGYFATYSIGSLYAAQFFAALLKQIPLIETEIANGNNSSVLKWLQTNIYDYGRYYTSENLCKKVTGETLSSQYFMDYVEKKYRNIYNI
jgi:carboxypeptidase Taq